MNMSNLRRGTAVARAAALNTALTMALTMALFASLGACASFPPTRAIQVASGSTSQMLCSAVFVSGRGLDQAYAEEMRPQGGTVWVDWALRYRLDPEHREVVTTIAGGFESRSRYRDGLGCLLAHGEPPALERAPALPTETPLLPPIAGPALVSASDPRIAAAVDAAFAEPDPSRPTRNTKAVVVLHRGRVIAERYAPGVGIDTAWHGHSISKSVTHALIGVLAREGKLVVGQPAPVAEWADPADARHAITIDQLLRMSAGFPWQRMGGFDDATRMWSIERDMAGFAATRPIDAAPGTRWNYSDGSYLLLSRIIRDAAGGNEADVLRLAHHELFGPLGMSHVTMEFDATGTPDGAAHFYASARDWARLGQLYLQQGKLGGRQILPVAWAQHAATPTLDTGYGAGFWLNRKTAQHNPMGFPWALPGAPVNSFFSFGYLGQYVIVLPEEQLVIVRLGVSHEGFGDRPGVGHLVESVVAAVRAP